MKKWRGLTDDDIDDELQHIAEEQALLSGENYMPEEGDMEELGEEEEALAKMEEHLVFLEEEGRRLVQAELLNIRDIEDNKLSIELQKEAIEAQKARIKKARENAEEKRLVMVDLMQDRKTHEILKDRAFEEFLQEEKADESKQIDQLTSYTYGQRGEG